MNIIIRLIFLSFLLVSSAHGLQAAQPKDIHTTRSTIAEDYLPSDSIFARYLQSRGTRITYGNNLHLITSGRDKFELLFDDLTRAKDHIHLEYFNFRGDSISRELFVRLARNVDSGVKVRAMFDDFGNISNDKPLTKKMVKQLNNEGIELVPFDPMRFPYLNHAFTRDHQKIAVIDGRVGYTGGMNIADYYINGLPEIGEWHDMHVRIQGPAVEDLQKAFLYCWNKETKQYIQGDKYFPYQNGKAEHCDILAVLRNTPSGTGGSYSLSDSIYVGGGTAIVQRKPRVDPSAMRDAYIAAIDAAEYSVKIITPYFTPLRNLRKALYRAARRGVKVEIMISSKSDIPFSPDAGFYFANKMRKAGVRMYSFNGGFHHSKIMIVDGRFCTVGSANLNSRSHKYDYEINAFIFDMRFCEELNQIFLRDQANSTVYTKDEYMKRSAWKRFYGWFARCFTGVL